MQVIDGTIRDNPPTHERVSQVYQHQKASRDSKQIKNRKDDVLLVNYSLVTIHLFIIIFIHLTQPKIQSVHPAASMNKTLITGFSNVLQEMP